MSPCSAGKTLLAAWILCAAVSPAEAADCWLSPDGAGSRDGRRPENALPAAEAQSCWNRTSPDGTMHVLPGLYSTENGRFWKLEIGPENDGSRALGGFKRLRAEEGAVLEGPRPVPYDPALAEKGGEWLRIAAGARDVWIEGFRVKRVAHGIVAKGGGNARLRFRDLDFEDTRQNLLIAGHPDCKSAEACVRPEKLTHDVRIAGVRGARYSKRHVRLVQGVRGVRVEDSHADAGFLDGDFAVGFDVEGPSRGIEFRNSSARRNRYSGSEYWNGDGFKTEGETREVRWIGCSAFDNADAGFDVKTPFPVLEDAVALRNGRNVRIWSPKRAVLRNVNASFARVQGGKGTAAGIWTQGELDCFQCTAHANPIQAYAENNGKSGRMRFFDSILSVAAPRGPAAGPESELVRLEEGTQVEFIRTARWKEGGPGEDPGFETELEGWEGGDSRFNSRRYGVSKGYFHR
jgi:hypothetical protein